MTTAANSKLWLTAFVVVMLSGVMQAQESASPASSGQVSNRPAHPTQSDMDSSPAVGVGSSIYQERRIRQLNLAQHKAMVNDTDKLLKLVTELNAEINRTSPAALTPEQLRKVAEIEKLARSVKDKMRISAQGSQELFDSQPMPPGPPLH